jgi:hypothetical protein
MCTTYARKANVFPYMDSSEMCFELDEQYFMKAFALRFPQPASTSHHNSSEFY